MLGFYPIVVISSQNFDYWSPKEMYYLVANCSAGKDNESLMM